MGELNEAQRMGEEGPVFEFDILRDMDLTYMEKSDLRKLEEYAELEWFVDVCQLDQGLSFGELALTNEEGASLR